MLISVHLYHLGLIVLISILSFAFIKRIFKIDIKRSTFFQIVLLINPWPLFMISPGAAGFIYSADLLAVYYLSQKSTYDISKKAFPFVLILLFLYLIQPLINSSPYIASSSPNELKYLVLQIFRGGLYMIVYLMFFRKNANTDINNIILSIAIWWFFYLFVCLLHYLNFITLSNNFLPVTKIDKYNLGKIGSGTFGLYRGALGALSCIILFVSLPLLIKKTGILFSGCFILLTILIEIFAASRMSVIFTVSYITYLFFLKSQSIGKKIILVISIALVFISVSNLSILKPYFHYFDDRFVNQFIDKYDNYDNILLQRDPKIGKIISQDKTVFELIFGNALNYKYVDSELFLLFQKNGLIGLLLYFSFIIGNLYHLSKKKLIKKIGGDWLSLGLLWTCVFIPFHFYIYSTFTHQAVSSYILFAFYGIWIKQKVYRHDYNKAVQWNR